MYIIIAILAFGILIADHELGHFLAAKACGVKVNEFAIGMGPAIFKKQGKETLYSLRILPLGGYCAMEGEDEAMDDERAFSSQPAWKKIIILVAGSAMNFILGLIVVLIVYSGAQGFAGNTVVELVDGFKYAENGIMVGDEILSIDGHKVYYSDDFSTYMGRSDGTVDMVVRRNGEKITLKNYGLRPENYIENGETVYRYGLAFGLEEANVWGKVKFSCYTTYNFVRMVGMSLSDLVTGAVGVKDMAGVVGIVDTINKVGEQSATTGDALLNIGYLCAFIAVNLSVMNMLPIPALDGGRVFAIFITGIITAVTGKKPDPRIEGFVHGAGLVLLLAFMAFVMFNDVLRLIK